MYVLSWLRSHDIKTEIAFTVDQGEEFGSRSWLKVTKLGKLIRSSGCRLIQNYRGHCAANAHVGRSHRTDDDEFYIPTAAHIDREQELLDEAMGYLYYDNNVREHSCLGYRTPFAHLKEKLPDIGQRIRVAIPVMLDKVAAQLGASSAYNVLPQHRHPVGQLG